LSFETILVDNASTDNSACAISEKYPQVRLIALEENIGFARANNLAAQQASGEYLLLLNPDTVVINNAIEKLLAFAQGNKQAGICGGRTIFSDSSLNPTSCFGQMTPWSLFCRAIGLTAVFENFTMFNPECFGSWQYDSVRKVDIVTGCFMLIKASLWEELGGFDPIFFMYGEEVDFCLRAKKLGYSPMFTPEAEIIHHGGASEFDQVSRWEKVFQAKSTLMRLHWSRKHFWFGLRMLLMWVATRAVIMSILGTLAPKRFGFKKEKWAGLWRRRKEWQLGLLTP